MRIKTTKKICLVPTNRIRSERDDVWKCCMTGEMWTLRIATDVIYSMSHVITNVCPKRKSDGNWDDIINPTTK